MKDPAQQALGELITQYGRALCDDPRRLRALLSDLCPGSKREVHVLLSALEQRVPQELANTADSSPWEVIVGRLSRRLVEEAAIIEDMARWAVESWAVALGCLTLDRLESRPPRAITHAPAERVAPEGVIMPRPSPNLGQHENAAKGSLPVSEKPVSRLNAVLVGFTQIFLGILTGLGVCVGIWFFLLRDTNTGSQGGDTRPAQKIDPLGPQMPIPPMVYPEKVFDVYTFGPQGEIRKALLPPDADGRSKAKWERESRARKFADAKEWDKAIAELTEPIRAEPDKETSYTWYHDRGVYLLNARRYDEAIGDLQKSLQLKAKGDYPFPDPRRTFLGDAYRLKGDREAAITWYTAAINENPLGMGTGWARLQRGRLLADKGDYPTAIADYSVLLDHGSKGAIQAQAYAWRGEAYLQSKQADKAIADYTKALELQAQAPRIKAGAHHNRGRAYEETGHLDLALADYNDAITAEPTNAIFYHNRGVYWARKGDDTAAVNDYTRAIQHNPRYALAYHNRAIAYERLGWRELAQKGRERAQKLGLGK